MDVRYRVNAYDEQSLFNENSRPDTDMVAHRSHVRLGSLNNIIHLSLYAQKLNKDIKLQDLQTLLKKFLHLNRILSVDNREVSGLQVHGYLHVHWLSAHTRTGGSLSRFAGDV